ncbi:hypothetical protein QBC41DRAFT_127841 [Cercophora samala]|uniref:Uncharacterized protein n=1 Tax=Cercophora samala TaxID=330535 RepID=A0AA39ZCE1_9PEZI|nr:hypothetical protein QBC41DRAFT_127841 [Cercophora samala]
MKPKPADQFSKQSRKVLFQCRISCQSQKDRQHRLSGYCQAILASCAGIGLGGCLGSNRGLAVGGGVCGGMTNIGLLSGRSILFWTLLLDGRRADRSSR